MRLEWIEDILAVLDTGSLARAAEQRFLTQSAFTRRVRHIEDAIGATLFDRARKPVVLLPNVARLEPEMRQLRTQLLKLRNELQSASLHAQGRFGIACQHAITATVSPSIVQTLTAEMGVPVRVKSANQDACLMQLLTGTVDIAFVYSLPGEDMPVPPQAIEVALIGQDLLVPACAPALQDIPLSGRLPIIGYPADVFLGQVFERHVLPRLPPDLTLETKVETALTLAACQFALDGIGIAWLPQSLLAQYRTHRRLIALDRHLPTQALEIRMLRLAQAQTADTDAIWAAVKRRAADVVPPAPNLPQGDGL